MFTVNDVHILGSVTFLTGGGGCPSSPHRPPVTTSPIERLREGTLTGVCEREGGEKCKKRRNRDISIAIAAVTATACVATVLAIIPQHCKALFSF